MTTSISGLPKTQFVGRTHELSRLQEFLNLAKNGTSQVCFIAGEAGAGKSALLEKFQIEEDKLSGEIIFVTGQCNGQVGQIDPYLPFKTVLQGFISLMSNVDRNQETVRKFARLFAKTIIDLSPDLIGNFFPGGLLLAKGLSVLIEKSGVSEQILVDKSSKRLIELTSQLSQSEICQQYTSLLQTLAKNYVIVLIIEDLHWADQSSINLLFHLVRSLKQEKIVIVGTYRPEDVKIGVEGNRHPLDSILNEICRYRGDITIDLNQISDERRSEFINSLIDVEPNELDNDFRRKIFDITEGNALFSTEMLNYLKENGYLYKNNNGSWRSQKDLNWDRLPSRVEAIIKERVERLSEELKQILTVASVEGESFTAQVVGRLQEVNDRMILERLSSQLSKKHRLVEEGSPIELKGTDLYVFRFTHSLIQFYIYNDISESERRILHKSVAETLETLYGENTDLVSPQLAKHFEEAHAYEKACHYLLASGNKALLLSAFNEARIFFERGIQLGSEKHLHLMYRKLGVAFYGLGQLEDAKAAFDKGVVLANQINNSTSIAECQAWLGRIYVDLGEFDAAKLAIEVGLSITDESNAELFAHLLNEMAYVNMGMEHLDVAESLYRKAIEICDSHGIFNMKSRILYDLGCCLHIEGQSAEAIQVLNEGLDAARSTRSKSIESYCLNELGWINYDNQNYGAAMNYFNSGLLVGSNIDNKWLISESLNGLGFCKCKLGRLDEAEQFLKEALKIGNSVNAMTETLLIIVGFAELMLKKENYQKAYNLANLALTHPSSDYEVKHFGRQTLSEITKVDDSVIRNLPTDAQMEYHALVNKLLAS